MYRYNLKNHTKVITQNKIVATSKKKAINGFKTKNLICMTLIVYNLYY